MSAGRTSPSGSAAITFIASMNENSIRWRVDIEPDRYRISLILKSEAEEHEALGSWKPGPAPDLRWWVQESLKFRQKQLPERTWKEAA